MAVVSQDRLHCAVYVCNFCMMWLCFKYVYIVSFPVCVVPVGFKNPTPQYILHASRQPRMQTSHRVLHIQTGM